MKDGPAMYMHTMYITGEACVASHDTLHGLGVLAGVLAVAVGETRVEPTHANKPVGPLEHSGTPGTYSAARIGSPRSSATTTTKPRKAVEMNLSSAPMLAMVPVEPPVICWRESTSRAEFR